MTLQMCRVAEERRLICEAGALGSLAVKAFGVSGVKTQDQDFVFMIEVGWTLPRTNND